MKEVVANEFSTAIDQICLIYSGKILKDDEDLNKHGMISIIKNSEFRIFLSIDIKDGVTLHLVIRAPKPDTTTTTAASASASSTSSEPQADVKIDVF